jgi:hypothetical protein
VLKVLFFTLFYLSSLFASKVLYVQYVEVPKRVIKGEIIPITFKTLSTVQDFEDINYTFIRQEGAEVLEEIPQREIKGKFYYDTFHLLVKSTQAALPDVNVSLTPPNETYETTFVPGQKLNVINLNPPKNFSNIIAQNAVLKGYKTTSYDTQHNIVVFVLEAKNSDLQGIHFKDVYKQGIESIESDFENAKVTYYVVIDKNIDFFRFSYFNLLQNDYKQLSIPIIVHDDSVTTQSDLKPRDQSHERFKMYAAAIFAFVALLIALIRKKYIYLLFTLLPLGYITYLNMPQQRICIKEGAKIYLLPVKNATVFETTQTKQELTKEGSVSAYVKVRLQNNKIGWVKNEDTCTH